MRFALISDIHANLPALQAVHADIAKRKDIGACITSPGGGRVEVQGDGAALLPAA